MMTFDFVKKISLLLWAWVAITVPATGGPEEPPTRRQTGPVAVHTIWDDLMEGIQARDDWDQRRVLLKQRFLNLIRDQHKPDKVPLELNEHESSVVEGIYERRLISYQVESDERAYAWLGIPLDLTGKAPAVVALHGTVPEGGEQTAGLSGKPDFAFLDQLCRRGYIVIAPEHFVSGRRTPKEGAYETAAFYRKHPEWTAVGKFTFEHSIAVDVLCSMDEVDQEHIGVMGHSLGGHGSIFLAAYDTRIAACASNCTAPQFRASPEVLEWSRNRWYIYYKHLRPLLLEGKLPDIDMHEIIALLAPRPYMDISALNDGDPLVQRQRVLMLMEIAKVYDLVGKPGNFSFYVHGHGHAMPHESRELIYGFMDMHLKPAEATRTHLLER